jgi:hypothetical protein
MTNTTAPTKPRSGALLNLRAKNAAWRSARATRGALQRELMTYRTPADVNDLLCAMAAQDGPDVDAMRRTLLANLSPVASTPLAA